MRRPIILLQLLLLVTLLGGSGHEAAAALSVEASLSHLAFPVDQGAMLSITVTGSGRSAHVELPEIAGITFTARGQASQMSLINGAISSSSTSNYLIQAEKPGVYTIPPIKVKVGGDSAVTRPMSFEVTPGAGGGGSSGGTAVSPGRSQAGEEAGFIRVSATGDHYPGEIVPVTIKAYFKERYRTDINSLVTMSGDGVVMPQLREKPEQTREVAGGETYNVLTWQTTLAGIKEGRHQLSFALEASLLVPQKRSSRSPFGRGGMFDDPMFNDPFFDSFFGGYQRRPVTVTSPPVVFNVMPLPDAGRPEGFSGAIGQFDLQVSANSREIEVGEPLTLTTVISGQGNFDRVEAPAFPASPDWKNYSPTATFTGDQAGHGTGGTKRFEQAIVARNPAVSEIPGLSFSYFDPAVKEYVTRTSSPIKVTVTASAAAPAAPPTSAAATGSAAPKTAQPQQTQAAVTQLATGLAGLAPIRLQAGEFQPRLVPLWQKAWFLTVCGLCLVTLFALLIRGVLQHNRQLHPERERSRQRKAELRHALQHLEQAKTGGDGAAFLALCRTAIQHHLGPRWHMVPSAISLADLRARLAPDSPLIEIFRAADEAAYGGATPSPAKIQDYLDILHRELERLV